MECVSETPTTLNAIQKVILIGEMADWDNLLHHIASQIVILNMCKKIDFDREFYQVKNIAVKMCPLNLVI